MAWTVLGDSATGASHAGREQPCQDAFRWALLGPDGKTLLIVVADGAGSAELAEVGARLACDEAVRIAQSTDDIDLKGWFTRVRDSLRDESIRRECPIRQLACTLLLAVIGEQESHFAQVGDGAIVVKKGCEWEVVFWPEPGEYANATHFLTDGDFDKSLSVHTIIEPVFEISLFSDGLQRLALDFGSKRGHAAFFDPLFSALQNTPDSEALRDAFRSFLESPRVNSRTDDDKTLVIALRNSP